MNSIEMTLEALAKQIQQNEKQQERLKKQEEKDKTDQTKLSKLLKDGKVTNPLLLIFFIQIEGMKAMSKGLNPLLGQNTALEREYADKMDKVNSLNQQLKKLLTDPNYSDKDQSKALKLQSEISQTQVDAQRLQQKEQSLWAVSVQPQESNLQGASNMAANSIQLLDQSRQQFLSTTR